MTQKEKKPSEFALELLRDLASAFTRHPRNLEVDGSDMTGAIVLAIRCDRDDHPKLVGSQGKHIQALQSIFAAHGEKTGRRVNLTLLEPAKGQKGPPVQFQPDPNWNRELVKSLMGRVLDACLPEPYRLNIADSALGLTTIEVLPQRWGELCQRGDFARAVHAIFHAIGKTQGVDLHVNFTKAPAGTAAAPAGAAA